MPIVAKRFQTKRPAWLVLYLLSLAVSLTVLITATSRFFTTTNPALALSINPLNTSARIDLLATNLSKYPERRRLGELQQLAIDGIAFEPMDARFFSLLGIVRERAGENENAQNLYRHALKLLPTEIQALSRRFVFAVGNANHVEAVSIADIISKRWRKHWNLISPYLPYLLDNDAAYEEALTRFSRQKNGKHLLVSSLINKTGSLDLAYRMIMDWHKSGENNLRGSINQLSGKLVAIGQQSKAWQLYRLTLNAAQEKETGYVFNGNFNLDPNGNLFDWNIVKQSGINMSIKAMAFKSDIGKPILDRVLETRFLDSPVRFSAVLQTLRLPAASFTLNLVYTARGLTTPKPVKLAIECRKSRKRLAVVEISPADITRKILQASFSVPADKCKLQQIRMFNGNIVESWKNRYSGSLLLHSVSIKLGGN